jgi:hypothetical protein
MNSAEQERSEARQDEGLAPQLRNLETNFAGRRLADLGLGVASGLSTSSHRFRPTEAVLGCHIVIAGADGDGQNAFDILIKERDAHIEKLIQAKRDVARLKALRAGRTEQQERELSTAQKIVDNEPAVIAMLDERLAAAAD